MNSESDVTDSETCHEKGRRCTQSLTLLTVKHVMRRGGGELRV